MLDEDLRAYPEGLTPGERRVLDFMREGVLDAEIAVRMGVPVGDVKERIERMRAKTGMESRAALLAWSPARSDWARPAEAGGPALPTPDEGPVETEAGEVAPVQRGMSRRAVLGGTAVAAIAAGAGALGATLFGRRAGAPGAETPGEGATAEFTGAPASVTEQPEPVYERDDLAFEVLTYGAGDPIAEPDGVFLMSVETGRTTGYRVRKASQRPAARGTPTPTTSVFTGTTPTPEPEFMPLYGISPGGRFVSAVEGQRSWIGERGGAGATITWRSAERRLIALGRSHALLQVVKGQYGEDPTRELEVLDLDQMAVARAFKIPDVQPAEASPWVTNALFSPADGAFAFWVSPWQGGTGTRVAVLWRVDRKSEDIQPMLRIPIGDGGAGAQLLPLLPFHDGEGFLAAVGLPAGPGERTFGDGGYIGHYYAWAWTTGREVLPSGEIPLALQPATSPDGQSIVAEDWLRLAPQVEHGEFWEWWPAVSVRDRDGQVRFRVRSATTLDGDHSAPNRWLADGSGFVVATGAGREPVQPGPSYVVVSSDGKQITSLPPLPGGPHGFDFFGGASPSPRDTNIICFGRLHVFNTATGRWTSANVANEAGPGHLDPWVAGPDVIAFTLPEYGHDAGGPTVLLTPKVEFPSFSDRLDVVVARAGDCLNLRETPALDGRVLDCLPDGTPLTVAPGRDGRAAESADGRVWVRVSTASGAEGWVSSAYLDWA